MCGIFGVMFHSNDKVPDKERLLDTARLLGHRGPDHYGIYAEAGIGLVHTRLSLLDLSPRSNQPFWDKEGRYCLVYNGEIYNFKEIRSELEKRGVKFTTTSDTEVLLASIIKDGIAATLPKLEGMFAFAVYDRAKKLIVIARDRFGIKPLFFYKDEAYFIFVSEVNAIRPWVNLKPDFPSVSAFVSGFEGPTKGHSFFDNINFLAPGSSLTVGMGGKSQSSIYFNMTDFLCKGTNKEINKLKPSQVLDTVEELLLESVRTQLVADVPVGGLCSGGVDSSLILAMASRFHRNLAVFHANVVGRNSEYDAALLLAKHLKLDLEAVNVDDHDFIDETPTVTEHFGQPFYSSPQTIPLLMVFGLINSNGVKSILSGEGSDECYLGYSWLAPDIRKWSYYIGASMRKLVKILRGAKTNAAFSSQQLGVGLHTRFEVELDANDIRFNIDRKFRNASARSAWQTLELLNCNLRALLHRNDTMGMAASVEARFPFLDSNLVKFAVNMPYKYKIRFSPLFLDRNHYFFSDKWVIRKIAERYLPLQLCSRPKKPFPVDAFQRMSISPTFLQKSFIADMFRLSSEQAKFLIDNSDKVLKLKLMQLHVWASLFFDNVSKPKLVEQLRQNLTISPE